MNRALLALIPLFAPALVFAQTPCAPTNPVMPAAGVNCKTEGAPSPSAPTTGVSGAVHRAMQDARFTRADHLIAAHKCDEAKTYAATQRSLALTQHVDKACLPPEAHR